MSDILIQHNIDFYGTKASLYCSLLNGFSLVSHASEIKDSTGIWEIDAQGHGVAYGSVLSIESLNEVLPYVSKYLSKNICIEHEQKILSDDIRHSYWLSIDNKKISGGITIATDLNDCPYSHEIKRIQCFCKAISSFIYGMIYTKKEV
ncbi:hypothetical protein bpr_II354 (plasmid) [Butyrivibrio proteoclasticus B316]|uniref:Uncharacterized protein n=1 Tax=Butyrivibrio proteoclasticus (strain ATCC 51982 / DSM 14932 / B316) TaxID=515622 RepID=E0S4F9_BUTPB|nr:hypothetical protein [Butyrivibrio proteoclasticus]ADL36291.1 hypothetical protein bpr_II354 [Butyrivibrio proteoclasticus B316]